MSWSPRLEQSAQQMKQHWSSLVPVSTGIQPRYLVIIQRAATRHAVRTRDILGSRQFPPLVKARKEIAQELHDQGLSLPAIGRIMRRHHTSILHYLGKGKMTSKERIEALEAENARLREIIAALQLHSSEPPTAPSTPARSTPDGTSTEAPESPRVQPL